MCVNAFVLLAQASMLLHLLLPNLLAAADEMPEWLRENDPKGEAPRSGAEREHGEPNDASSRSQALAKQGPICSYASHTASKGSLWARPNWTAPTGSPLAIRLIVGVQVNVSSEPDMQQLHRCVCSVHRFHPNSFVHMVGSARTSTFKAHLQRMITPSSTSERARMSLLYCQSVMCSVRALRTSAAFALETGATHFAFLKQDMYLRRPLPLGLMTNNACPFMSFQVSRQKQTDRTYALQLRHMLAGLTVRDPNASTVSFNGDAGAMATAEEMAKAVAEGTHPGGDVLRVALRERRTSATVWLTGDKHALRLLDATHERERVPGHGFMCTRRALHKLAYTLSSRMMMMNPKYAALMQSSNSNSSETCDEEWSESVLAAIARYRLDSSPLTCNLDGCAPRPSSPSSEPWTPARFDEAACQGATVLERVTVPDFGGRLWWGPPLEKDDEAAMLRRSYILSVASAEFRCTSGSTNEEPSATVRSMKTASITDQQVAATAAGSSAVLLPRYVGPSDRIAREVLVSLLADGRPIFGAAAIARLKSEPRQARRVLIYLASFTETIFDASYSRALSLPQMRQIPIVREAAILMACNNHGQSMSTLISRLRRYPQRARWLIHSPLNPGMRGEQKPGYLCGEMQSLVISQPIWSRYEWVIHTHADVFPTPELFSSLRAKLFGQSQTMSTSGSDGVSGIATRQNNRKRAPDVYVDRFPRGAHRRVRYSMELMVFRTEPMLPAEPREFPPTSISAPDDGRAKQPATRPAQSTSRRQSAFAEALQTCLLVKGIFPEDLLHLIAVSRGLTTAPLGAVVYPKFSQLYSARVRAHIEPEALKTELFPGAVWHNHNYTQLDAYMTERELNASLGTGIFPNPEQRKAYPFAS